MKVTKEYDIAWSGTNPETGKKLYALRPNGNCCIYTDDGELLEATDEGHVQALIHYYELRERDEGKDAVRS